MTEEGQSNGQGQQDQGNGKAAEQGSKPEGSKFTPPASQEDLDKLIQARVARAQAQFGMTPEEAKSFKDRAEALDYELSSEKDKAVKDAKDEATKLANDTFRPQLVGWAFKAAAAGRIDAEALDGILEPLDLSKFLSKDGGIDEGKIAAFVDRVAPKAADPVKRSGPSFFGQGTTTPTQQAPGQAGRDAARARFNLANTN